MAESLEKTIGRSRQQVAKWNCVMPCMIIFMLIAIGIVGCQEQHRLEHRIKTRAVTGYVYEGSTLIGVCGGQPPGVMPQSSDPSVDVTWYPECPR